MLLISGRVQGVGFRWFTKKQAHVYGVHGYVRNLPDGRVEVLAQAETAAMARFCDALCTGSPGSRVDDVSRASAAVDRTITSFSVTF